MGENPFEGNVKLYYGDSLVELPYIVEGATFDIGDEEGDKGVYSNNGFEISFTATVDDVRMKKFIDRWMKRDKMYCKALLWAVTHGYYVMIWAITENGEERNLCITRPSALRHLFRLLKFVPRFSIFDKQGNQRKIRKGKVV